MNKFRVAMLVCFTLVVSLFAAVAVTAPASAVSCYTRRSGDSATVHTAGDDITVYATVTYQQCSARGRHWSEPMHYTIGYNREGTSRSCDWTDPFQNVTYNGYFWDQKGHNYNPPPDILFCARDTTAFNTYYLDGLSVPRFVRCAYGVPRWKFNVKVSAEWPAEDKHTTLYGRMWDFIGPVPDNAC